MFSVQGLAYGYFNGFLIQDSDVYDFPDVEIMLFDIVDVKSWLF